MARKTNRREFVQAAGLAASGFMAAARPLAGAVPGKGTEVLLGFATKSGATHSTAVPLR